MNNSGEAAEQIVKMSLEGTEVALKLTGSAAKNIAAGIYAVMKNRDKNKLKGKQRLTSMLKSGKELKVFTVSEEHLKQFAKEAKRYGVVYCALRGKDKSSDGLVDVMVRAEDASKINRIVERFKLATVDAASIKHDIEKSKAEKSATHAEPEKGVQEKSAEDKLIDEMLGTSPNKEEKAITNPTAAEDRPFVKKGLKSRPSEHISKKRSKVAEGVTKKAEKPSVREELREIKEKRQKSESPKSKEQSRSSKNTPQINAEHKQPGKKKKNKSKGR